MSLFKRKQQHSTDTMDNGAKLITVAHPKSPISEQFRTIRTNINFMAIDKPIKTLAMTSANMSEGKSTVTDNVAVVWAQTGQRVLLIDSDLRRPTLHATFNKSNQHGLTTILTSGTNSVDLREIIQSSGVENLDILTSGPIPPIPPNPAELLNSQRMKTLLDTVKGIYDMVIVDVPPMLEVTDTQILSRHLDAIVLVVK